MTERRQRDVFRIPEWFDSDPEMETFVTCQPEDGGDCPSRTVLCGRLSVDGVFTPSNNHGVSHPAFTPSHGDAWECSQCDPSQVIEVVPLPPWEFAQ